MNDKADRPDTLDYLPPRDDVERKKRERSREWISCISAMLSTWGISFVFVVTNIQMGAPVPMNFGPSLVALAIAGFVIGGPAVYLWKRGSRGFAIGALIGVGIALLAEGLCYLKSR